jgi:hypothetical protein
VFVNDASPAAIPTPAAWLSLGIGGLVLEVKGDFCHDVHRMLVRHGRDEDYLELSLEGPWRYNPLHNDLDAYALAYGIASLLNSVFGKGKEPFWQQAYTNLVKFVILLHQTLDGYVTLFQVYEHVINADKLQARIAEGERRFGAHRRRIGVNKSVRLDASAVPATPVQLDGAGDAVAVPRERFLALLNDAHDVRPFAFDAGAERAEPVRQAGAIDDVDGSGDILANAFPLIHGPDAEFGEQH